MDFAALLDLWGHTEVRSVVYVAIACLAGTLLLLQRAACAKMTTIGFLRLWAHGRKVEVLKTKSQKDNARYMTPNKKQIDYACENRIDQLADAQFLPEFKKRICSGREFIKYRRRGKPQTRMIVYYAKLGTIDYQTGLLKLSDVTHISTSAETAIFKKHKQPVDANLCLSLHTGGKKGKTLDLQARDKAQRDRWVRGIRLLLAEAADKESPAGPLS